MQKKILATILFALTAASLFGGSFVHAKDEPRPLVNPLAGFTATTNQDTAGAFAGAVGLFVYRAILALGALAVIPIIVGGIYLLSSSGNPDMVKKGKDSLFWGIVGLILALSSFVIYNFLLSLAIQ
jgi:hypothetical protein